MDFPKHQPLRHNPRTLAQRIKLDALNITPLRRDFNRQPNDSIGFQIREFGFGGLALRAAHGVQCER